jgi:hypothetical protein
MYRSVLSSWFLDRHGRASHDRPRKTRDVRMMASDVELSHTPDTNRYIYIYIFYLATCYLLLATRNNSHTLHEVCVFGHADAKGEGRSEAIHIPGSCYIT